jgi:hypothetical protein
MVVVSVMTLAGRSRDVVQCPSSIPAATKYLPEPVNAKDGCQTQVCRLLAEGQAARGQVMYRVRLAGREQARLTGITTEAVCSRAGSSGSISTMKRAWMPQRGGLQQLRTHCHGPPIDAGKWYAGKGGDGRTRRRCRGQPTQGSGSSRFVVVAARSRTASDESRGSTRQAEQQRARKDSQTNNWRCRLLEEPKTKVSLGGRTGSRRAGGAATQRG